MKSAHPKIAELKLDDSWSQEASQACPMPLGWRRKRKEMMKVRGTVPGVKTTFLWRKANVVGPLGFLWTYARQLKILQLLEEVSQLP